MINEAKTDGTTTHAANAGFPEILGCHTFVMLQNVLSLLNIGKSTQRE